MAAPKKKPVTKKSMLSKVTKVLKAPVAPTTRLGTIGLALGTIGLVKASSVLLEKYYFSKK